MPHYEVIYETGAHGVAFYEDDAEAASALKAHNDRAVAGERGGPGGHPAERIARVLEYEEHPVDLMADQTLSADVVKKELETALKANTNKDGVVYVPDLTTAIRDITRPIVDANVSSPHDSIFKAEETRELEASSWQ